MRNKEKKHKLWEELSKNYSHLSNYCTIEARGIDDDSLYFHPVFTINENVYITTQGDVNNKYIYAHRFVWDDKRIGIDIGDNLLDPIVVGFHTNRESVEFAMNTMSKVRDHIQTLNNYTTDYITNILIGNSVGEITNAFINELKTNQKLIEFMQSKK